jgi:hypothetical protein
MIEVLRGGLAVSSTSATFAVDEFWPLIVGLPAKHCRVLTLILANMCCLKDFFLFLLLFFWLMCNLWLPRVAH